MVIFYIWKNLFLNFLLGKNETKTRTLMVVSNNNFTKVDQYQNLFQKSRAIPKQIKFNFLTKKYPPI